MQAVLHLTTVSKVLNPLLLWYISVVIPSVQHPKTHTTLVHTTAGLSRLHRPVIPGSTSLTSLFCLVFLPLQSWVLRCTESHRDSGRNTVVLSISDSLRAERFGVWTPVGVRSFLLARPDRLRGPPSLLYKWYRIPFPGGKAAELCLYHPVSSSIEVVWVELYSVQQTACCEVASFFTNTDTVCTCRLRKHQWRRWGWGWRVLQPAWGQKSSAVKMGAKMSTSNEKFLISVLKDCKLFNTIKLNSTNCIF